MAWNILRDGITENIDFERDVGEFRLIEDTSSEENESNKEAEDNQNNSQADMNSHLEALIEAARQREGNIPEDV